MAKNIGDLDLLCQREIEIKIISPLIRAFAAEIGEERAFEISRKAIGDTARAQGAQLSSAGANGLKSLKNTALAMNKHGSLDLTVIEDTENVLRYNVTRCCFAEQYEKFGCKDVGTLLSCDRDVPFLEGFDDSLELIRNKTIMGGDDVCDFCYRKKNDH